MYSYYSNALLAERKRAEKKGSFRDKVRFDLIPRPPYAFGLLAAADIARFCGIKELVAIEFGVAEGAGLLNMCELATQVTEEAGVHFTITGFDTGTGLPVLSDYRDHPEVWSEGDFPVLDKQTIASSLPNNAQIIWGDVAQTVPAFLASLSPKRPIGFVSVDLDIYRSSKDALSIYGGSPEHYLPVSVAYFDDTLGGPSRIGSAFRNRWAGQLLAIEEFNAAHSETKIDQMRILKYRRPMHNEQWLEQVYGVHRLDHSIRKVRNSHRKGLTIAQHAALDQLGWRL